MAKCFCGCGLDVGGFGPFGARNSASKFGASAKATADALEAKLDEVGPSMKANARAAGVDPGDRIPVFSDQLDQCRAVQRSCLSVAHGESDSSSVNWPRARAEIKDAQGALAFLSMGEQQRQQMMRG